jgi:hypothetical protein
VRMLALSLLLVTCLGCRGGGEDEVRLGRFFNLCTDALPAGYTYEYLAPERPMDRDDGVLRGPTGEILVYMGRHPDIESFNLITHDLPRDRFAFVGIAVLDGHRALWARGTALEDGQLYLLLFSPVIPVDTLKHVGNALAPRDCRQAAPTG